MMKVLVVEDNEANMKLAVIVLESGGYQVVQAVDGAQGIDQAKRELPDLILMDIQLPGTDGLTATPHPEGGRRYPATFRLLR